jgi:hypothetical protein
MVELKEGENIYGIAFKNEEKYINGVTIAKFLQMMLNTANGTPDFYVAYQKDTSNIPTAKYGGVLSCEIEPFSLRGTCAQTINIDYKCKVSSQDAKTHAKVNATLESIIGPVEGSFKVAENDNNNGVTYYFWSNFTYAKPTTAGDVDGAVFPTMYNIKGYMHVVRERGAVLSNAVKSYVVLNGTRHEVALRRGSHGVSFTVSNPIKAGSFIASTEYLAAGYAKSLYILYKDDEVGRVLRDFTENRLEDKDNPFLISDGKYEIVIEEDYPDGKTIKTKYFIVQATCERESGAYATFALSLMQQDNTTIEG